MLISEKILFSTKTQLKFLFYLIAIVLMVKWIVFRKNVQILWKFSQEISEPLAPISNISEMFWSNRKCLFFHWAMRSHIV